MKPKTFRTVFFMMLVSIILSMPVVTKAQSYIWSEKKETNNGGEIFRVLGTVDSLNTYVSNHTTFNNYYDTTLTLLISKVVTSTAGTPKVTVYLEGDYGDGNWFRIDSLLVSDSVETYNRTKKLIYGTNIAPKFRINAVGKTGNRRDTYLDLTIWLPRKIK